MQSIDLTETYTYGMNEDLVWKKEEIKCNNIIKKYKKADYITKWGKLARNSWPSYRILIVWGSGSGKTNILLNLINNEPDIDKIYLCATDSNQAKYQLLINERESTDLKYFNDSKAFIEYSNDMDYIYKNI